MIYISMTKATADTSMNAQHTKEESLYALRFSPILSQASHFCNHYFAFLRFPPWVKYSGLTGDFRGKSGVKA